MTKTTKPIEFESIEMIDGVLCRCTWRKKDSLAERQCTGIVPMFKQDRVRA